MATVYYIMGVSGSGKTTVGEQLATAIQIPFFDGDDFHPEANKAKMKAGIPLTDQDRATWLKTLHQLAVKQTNQKGAIIACSALKQSYRQILSAELTSVHWIYLEGTYAAIYQRIQQRKGHFMPASLLQSQFNTLEVPTNAWTFSIEQTPAAIVGEILKRIREV